MTTSRSRNQLAQNIQTICTTDTEDTISLHRQLSSDIHPHSAHLKSHHRSQPIVHRSRPSTLNRMLNSNPVTSESSSSPASSQSSSVSASYIAGGCNHEILDQKTPHQLLRRRPCLSDLQQFRSAPELPHESMLAQKKSLVNKRHAAKKCVSADHRDAARMKFASPDRFAVTRSSTDLSSSPLRTSTHPSLLGTKERQSRQSHSNLSAFRSVSESRPHRTVSRPIPNRTRPFQPPHYTPSFVHRRDGSQVRDTVRSGTGSLRSISFGSVWRLGHWTSSTGQLHGVEVANGSITASGSNAPMMDSDFLSPGSQTDHVKKHEQRLALALAIDTAQRVLPINRPVKKYHNLTIDRHDGYQWLNSSWARLHSIPEVANRRMTSRRPGKVVPTIAFRVLDAPRLRDDFYCSVLAYCRTFRTLAVALTHRVYLWTEKYGVRYPPLGPARQNEHVTCLAFSSDEGGKAILATSRNNGNVTLWSLLEQKARFELPHPSSACSVAFKPVTTRRIGCMRKRSIRCEDLLVGDDSGRIYYYSVEWPDYEPGSVSLLTKIEAHTQNVCGLAWAPHGSMFVSGGNDNNAKLFYVSDVFRLQNLREFAADIVHSSSAETDALRQEHAIVEGVTGLESAITATASRTDRREEGASPTRRTQGTSHLRSTPNLGNQQIRGRSTLRQSSEGGIPTPPQSPTARSLRFKVDLADPNTTGILNAHKYSFYHSAAVKAISFAPWQPALLATSGGSNDRQIHFHHTETGTTLAVINVYAQVTSLNWSLTRREIVATFGYAQPDHEIRIAVFSWPSCECVVSIPWERKANGEIGRALWAIPYPGGPNDAAPDRLQETTGAHEFWGVQRTRQYQMSTGRSELHGQSTPLTPETSPGRRDDTSEHTRIRNSTRGEGEAWASRTHMEGSLIIACCDQTVKFFEVWAGKSKGKYCGLGSKAGVLGSSKVLEGWCEGMAIEEIGAGEDVIQ